MTAVHDARRQKSRMTRVKFSIEKEFLRPVLFRSPAWKAKAMSKKRPPRLSPRTYIACCSYHAEGEHPAECTFQLVLAASTPQAALNACRKRIVELQKHDDSYIHDTRAVYLNGLVEVSAAPKVPVLVNYLSHHAKGAQYTVGCLIPDQGGTPGVDGFGLEPDDGKTRTVKPFVSFRRKGARSRDVKAHATRA
jgi:hypothetical protein